MTELASDYYQTKDIELAAYLVGKNNGKFEHQGQLVKQGHDWGKEVTFFFPGESINKDWAYDYTIKDDSTKMFPLEYAAHLRGIKGIINRYKRTMNE